MTLHTYLVLIRSCGEHCGRLLLGLEAHDDSSVGLSNWPEVLKHPRIQTQVNCNTTHYSRPGGEKKQNTHIHAIFAVEVFVIRREESPDHLLCIGIPCLHQKPFESGPFGGLQCYQNLLATLDLHRRGSDCVGGGGALPWDAVSWFQVPTGGVRSSQGEA